MSFLFLVEILGSIISSIETSMLLWMLKLPVVGAGISVYPLQACILKIQDMANSLDGM